MKSLVISFLLFSSLCGVTQDVSKKMVIEVSPYKKVSNGAFFQVITLHSPDCYVEYLDGFDFEWGYIYDLKVKETHLASPPEDGSSYRYELIEVISKTAVPTNYTFQMILSRDLYLGHGSDQVSNFKVVNDSTYRYMDEINIEFTSEQAHLFDNIIKNDKYLRGTFTFINSNTIRLK